MKRILLGQLGSNGDCLYATTIARQIKHDFPGCHLTWAISDLCREVIKNNPHVDEVWEVGVGKWLNMRETWKTFEQEVWRSVKTGEYDHVFTTQIFPNQFCNYDGTVRPSIFRNYPRPITVPVDPVIVLTDDEKEKVRGWYQTAGLNNFEKVVLFECSSKSGQSFVTPSLAVKIAENVLTKNPDIAFVISTHEKVGTQHPQIFHGGHLSMRETAELTLYCDLFAGCGSGLTVVSTSTAAKSQLPNLQILNGSTSVYASFKHDFEFFDLPSGHFLETTESEPSLLADTILSMLDDGVDAAREKFGAEIDAEFTWYLSVIERSLVQSEQYVDAAQSLAITINRYGATRELVRFAAEKVLPFCDQDQRAQFKAGKKSISELRALV